MRLESDHPALGFAPNSSSMHLGQVLSLRPYAILQSDLCLVSMFASLVKLEHHLLYIHSSSSASPRQ